MPVGLFYPDYAFQIFQADGKIFDVSSFAVNNIVTSFFYLFQPKIGKNFEVLSDQKITIYDLFMGKGFSRMAINRLVLTEITKKLNSAMTFTTQNFKFSLCDRIYVMYGGRVTIRCRMYNDRPKSRSAHLVYAVLKIFNSKTKKRANMRKDPLGFEIESVVSPPITDTKYVASCFVNLDQIAENRANQKYVIRPFLIAFYEETQGLFMLTQDKEHLELLKIDEIEKNLKLKNWLCSAESKTMTLRFTKPIPPDLLGNPTKAVYYVFNLDSKFRGNNRIEAKIEKNIKTKADGVVHLSPLFRKRPKLFSIGETHYEGQYKIDYFRLTVDLGYPRISLSVNSTQNFSSLIKIYTSRLAYENGLYGFSVNVNAVREVESGLRVRTGLPVLENREYNFENFLEVEGDFRSFQVYHTSKRVTIKPRLNAKLNVPINNEDYLFILLIPRKYFFGVTSSSFALQDHATEHFSSLSYSLEVKAICASCCSETQSFYALHYDPSIRNPYRIAKYEVSTTYGVNKKVEKLEKNEKIQFLENFEKNENLGNGLGKATTRLRTRYSHPINDSLLSDINTLTSKMFVTAISDGVVAICFHTKEMVKILIVIEQEEKPSQQSLQDSPTAQKSDKMGKISLTVEEQHPITSDLFDVREDIIKAEIVSMSMTQPYLRTFLVAVGTESRIGFLFMKYKPLNKENHNFIQQPLVSQIHPQFGSLDYIDCSRVENSHIPKKPKITYIKASCVIAIRAYTLKTFDVLVNITEQSAPGVLFKNFIFSQMKLKPKFSHKIPRFSKILVVQGAKDYIAVLVSDLRDFHKEILIYKRNFSYVWASVYIGYEQHATFELKTVADGRTFIFMKTTGSDFIVYQLSNSTISVSEGYEVSGSFELAYSTFQAPRVVSQLSGVVSFSDHLVVKSNFLLVIYGSIGGFFGFIVLIWCCCCLWRCIYVCVFRRFFEKREKHMKPVFVKKKRRRSVRRGRRN